MSLTSINFLIKLVLSSMNFQALAAFAQTIHDGFIAQIADYPTPNPLMLPFQSAIDDLNDAITKWGVEGARGSKADHNNLKAQAKIVRGMLRQLADYAQNTMPNNPDSWQLVGFAIKAAKSKPVALEKVQNLRTVLNGTISVNDTNIRWKRPLGTKAGLVKGYILVMQDGPAPPAIEGGKGLANIWDLSLDTNYVVQGSEVAKKFPAPVTKEVYLFVIPYNSVDGVVAYGGIQDPIVIPVDHDLV